MGELVFARPLVLAALVLPVALLLAARLFARPEREATGSLSVWKKLVAVEGKGRSTARLRVPPELLLCAASVALGLVGLAAPRFEPRDRRRSWTAVVDRRPGMFLPLSHAAARTRLAAALDSARAQLASAARPGDVVRWVTPERSSLDLAPDALPPAEWLAQDPWFAPRPPFEAHDLSGAIWITDRALAAHSASVIASGGEEAPGSIGDHAGRMVEWRGGADLVEVEAPARAIRFVGASADDVPLLRDMARSYAAARGLVVAEELTEREARTALVLLLGADEPGEAFALGRDGWRVEARLGTPPAIERPPETIATWLVLPSAADRSADRALVRQAPGVVSIGFRPTGDPEGDPASFAVSWARLFDEALLPRAGAAPLEAREALGPPSSRAGEPPPEDALGRTVAPPPLEAWLAAAAAACALAGAALTARRRS